MLGITNKKARTLETMDLYCLANEPDIIDVLSQYGEDCPAMGETICLAAVVHGDEFLEDLYDATQDGDSFPWDSCDDFCDFWNRAIDMMDEDSDTHNRHKKNKRRMKNHHWAMILGGIIVVVVVVLLYKKYAKK